MIDSTPDITKHLDDTQLNALIDSELPLAAQQLAEQHLTTCHPCTLRVLNATRLKTATTRAAHRFTPPAAALDRLTAKLHNQVQLEPTNQPAIVKPIRHTSKHTTAWTALAATLLLALALFGWRQLNSTNTLSAELLDQHLATLSSSATPQVISTDRHTVKPWFQGRLPFSFNLPEPTDLPPDTALKGANLAYLNNQPAALLLFTIHKHEVSVFVSQRALSPDVAAQQNRNGFNVHSATTRNLRLTAVSDVNPTDLDALLNTLIKVQ